MIDGYPEEVVEAATALRSKLTGNAGHDILDIADALLAEREINAKKADAAARATGEDGEIWIARFIADAIRKGEA
jgi:hypothetical protein